jgi:hypothetical protein
MRHKKQAIIKYERSQINYFHQNNLFFENLRRPESHYTIKMDLKYIWCEDVEWIQVGMNGVHWRALVNIMTIWSSIIVGAERPLVSFGKLRSME